MHRVPLAISPVDGAPIFVAQGTPGAYLVRQNGAGPTADHYLVLNPALGGTGTGSTVAPVGLAGLAAGAAHLVANQEVWWACVLAVLAVLSLEWWIYARRT
jgi:hypothetical protein